MRYAHPLYIANFSAVKTEGLPYYHPSPRTKFSPNTKNPPFAINSGLFIFNSQHSSKWCPAVKHNALTATTSPHRDRHSALSPRPAPPHLPPLSKVRCCRPKKFGRLPEGLFPIRTINYIFRTIPLAFRRVRVCVCFICFASLRNFGHTR